MCSWGSVSPIYVIRRNRDGVPDGWHKVFVDSCISGYVQEMNKMGIVTVGCCCGHGDSPPHVLISAESRLIAERLGYKVLPFLDRKDVVSHFVGDKRH